VAGGEPADLPPGLLPAAIDGVDHLIAEELPAEVVTDGKPVVVERRNTPSTLKQSAIDMLKAEMGIGQVVKELDRCYQVIRAVAISNWLHTSTPRGEEKSADLKLVVSPDQVERLREVLANA
jgi:hypothetical protein